MPSGLFFQFHLLGCSCGLPATQSQQPSKTQTYLLPKISLLLGFPGGAVVENLPANAGDTGSSPGLGRSHMPRSS